MSLTKKQKFIFYHLTRNSIYNQKPIGSKFLAKKLKKFSPSTLRFYFQRLVEKGYLENNLSGREPTEKGWHYYLQAYKLNPEIDVSFLVGEQEIDEMISKLAELTKNVGFYRRAYESKYFLKGLKNLLVYFTNKEIVEDLLKIIEKIETCIDNVEDGVHFLIGNELKESETKKISLIIFKTKDVEFGFLGPRINYYHTFSKISEIFSNGKRK